MTPETAVIPIEASEVAVALRASQPQKSRSSGTMMKPPPTPNSALKKPATRPMRTKRTGLFLQRRRRRLRCRCQDEMTNRTVGTRHERRDLLDRLAEDPAAAAIFLDVDGVLAPI